MCLNFRCFSAGLLVLIVSFTVQAATPTLVVYTYDSFTSEWGPGPKVKTAFEARCNCTLDLVGLEDGVSMLNRLKLEGNNTRADVLLGLDTSLTAEARASGLFDTHGMVLENSSLPRPWQDDLFLPYDYGYFAFVYNRERLANPPLSLRQLVEDEQGPSILVQDPRTSTPGLGLLLWIKKVYGDEADDGLGQVVAAHRYCKQRLERSLWPFSQGRSRHGTELYHFPGLSYYCRKRFTLFGGAI